MAEIADALPAKRFVSHAYADATARDALIERLPTRVMPFVFPPITVRPEEFVSDPLTDAALANDGLIYLRGGASDRSFRVALERDYALVFVEGGGITVSRFLAAGALDRLHLVVAPVLIGNGRRGLQGPARQAMADCPRPSARRLALRDDLLWDLELRAASALPG